MWIFFLKKLNNPIGCSSLSSLLFNYTKNRMEVFDYSKLNTKYFNSKYIKLLALGHFSFLKYEDSKGDVKYKEAIRWLKTTDFYKKDSVLIKKNITPLNNIEFKKNLKNLNLIDTTFKEVSFLKILKKHSSNYYLIDFWATWCAPCIKGVKIMKEMNIPENVKVISISLDKEKDKEKWKVETKKLEQSITYWLDEKNDKIRSFLKFIELKSIPRYILIDKEMNLIDEAFYHPQGSQFLTKLRDVKNSKFW